MVHMPLHMFVQSEEYYLCVVINFENYDIHFSDNDIKAIDSDLKDENT